MVGGASTRGVVAGVVAAGGFVVPPLPPPGRASYLRHPRPASAC